VKLSEAKQLESGAQVHQGPAERGQPCLHLRVVRLRKKWRATALNAGYDKLEWIEATEAGESGQYHYFRPGDNLKALHLAEGCRRPRVESSAALLTHVSV
jgi:hypothetical protein